jgi:hypothetical protein
VRPRRAAGRRSVPAFGGPRLDERQQADLFFADLLGHSTSRSIGSSASAGEVVSGFGEVTQHERDHADQFFESFAVVPSAGGAAAPRAFEPARLPVQPYPPARAPDSTATGDSAEDVQLTAPFEPPLDAAIVWPNGKAYFFKGDKYVRYAINPEGIDPWYPKKIQDQWPGLWDCDIDAAVVWNDSTAYFFKGAEFIRYSIKDKEGAQSGYPKRIKESWPGLWERDIDAAIVLSDGAYFFKGDQYIRYPVAEPIDKQRADPPKKIRDKWPQLWERDIDAALVWNNGMAYFFKCADYIGYSTDGTRANASRAIKDYWKGLIGAPSDWRLQRFPPRPTGAPGGRAFFKDVQKPAESEKQPSVAAWVQREKAMVDQLIAGNMPDVLLRWVDIDLSYAPPNGRTITGTVRVLPDYLAIGNDIDYVHAPLDQWSAQRVASAFGCLLPTARICHAIYTSAAARKIKAVTRDYYERDRSKRKAPVGRDQDSSASYLEHSLAIQDEMTKATPKIAPGTLVAGHKKDVVLSSRLHPKGAQDESAWIAYHGFYDASGYPIEPCYHTASGALNTSIPKDGPAIAHQMQPLGHLFSDYSQGVRLVHPMMKVDGRWMCVAEVLTHPELSYLISSEGPIDPPRIPKPTRPMGGGAGI